MPRKRLIFTLLYDSGQFMLSRNFRLQKVGDLRWLQKNYNFSKISHSIDELIVLDVSRKERDINEFASTLKKLVQDIFVPVAAGGGVDHSEKAAMLLNSGADKLVVNTILHTDPELVQLLTRIYGCQCVVGSLDFRKENDAFAVYYDRGTTRAEYDLYESVARATEFGVGEIYLNSIDRDGTGNGYELDSLALIETGLNIPLIMSGGAGNARHLVEGALSSSVDAVATANLFNFIGDGLPCARRDMIETGIDLPRWNPDEILELRNAFAS